MPKTSGTRKGQAAIEYLMNYAWAIALIIIVGIAIFALDIGGLRTSLTGQSSLIQQRGETAAVEDIAFSASGNDADISVVNNGGNDIKVTQVNITQLDDSDAGATEDSTNNTLKSGERALYTVTGMTGHGKSAGDPAKLEIEIQYTDQDTSIDHTVRREITVTVEQ